jgi:tyrosine-specific transport protein
MNTKNMHKALGAKLLIAGCCVGAGMLGIPVMTGAVGFIPASLLFVIAWGYMAITGLILLELVLSFKGAPVNLITMAQKSIGTKGKILTFGLFVFLFYAIMVAYFIAGSRLIQDGLQLLFGLTLSFSVAGSLMAVILFATIVRGVRSVDLFNRAIMIGLIITYAGLIFFGMPHVEMAHLETMDFKGSLVAIPIMILSFGYHNLVPSLSTYLEGNKRLLVRSIVYGSLIPLVIYLFWEFVILGIVSSSEVPLWAQAKDQGEIVTEVLAKACRSEFVVHIARTFAFFAIATSLLPVALSCVDFLKDAFCVKEGMARRAFVSLMVVAPPYFIAMTSPTLFLRALNYAGGIAAVLLFGTLPALMILKRRKEMPHYFSIATTPVLILVMAMSLAVVVLQLAHETGVL